ncbi:thioesterase II family protein [Lysinibacillus sp. NPDC056232]|uniref:thioesterase II family protein n=1 Tax=Lysinibacillus sp. NPDC056232 TaxID=3345756 RepID=UPI0035E37503
MYLAVILHILLPDEQFLDHIIGLGGTGEEIISNRELLEIFIPIIKADYKIYELYKSRLEFIKFGVDITAFTGNSDALVIKDNVNEWSLYTHKMFTVKTFNGGQFFPWEEPEEVIHEINQTLLALSRV